MITIYNYIMNCCKKSDKIQPDIIQITELDIFYNKVRLNSESSIILYNSIKEKSMKMSEKIK